MSIFKDPNVTKHPPAMDYSDFVMQNKHNINAKLLYIWLKIVNGSMNLTFSHNISGVS
jgi:hypothetical protein